LPRDEHIAELEQRVLQLTEERDELEKTFNKELQSHEEKLEGKLQKRWVNNIF
jgi:hypothetical protein